MCDIICAIYTEGRRGGGGRESRKHLVSSFLRRDSIFVRADESVLSRINQEEQMFAEQRKSATPASRQPGRGRPGAAVVWRIATGGLIIRRLSIRDGVG